MIVLDTSAIVAIAMEEPEGELFDTMISKNPISAASRQIIQMNDFILNLRKRFIHQ